MVRISVDFSKNRFSDAELYTYSGTIVSNMTNNPGFEQTIPSIQTVSEARDAYFEALTRAQDGTKAETSVKKTKRAVLESLLKQLSLYVQLVGNDNATMVATTGFLEARKNTVITYLPVPGGIVASEGPNSGSLQVKCNVIASARYYEFRYCQVTGTDEPFWHTVVSTRSKIVIEGLTPGKEYALQVLVSTAKTRSGWSKEIRKYVS